MSTHWGENGTGLGLCLSDPSDEEEKDLLEVFSPVEENSEGRKPASYCVALKKSNSKATRLSRYDQLFGVEERGDRSLWHGREQQLRVHSHFTGRSQYLYLFRRRKDNWEERIACRCLGASEGSCACKGCCSTPSATFENELVFGGTTIEEEATPAGKLVHLHERGNRSQFPELSRGILK
eukprot:scaffold1148_cov122-Amphora_coffeaeformis.AAC.3